MGTHLSWNIIILAFSLVLASPHATAAGSDLSRADQAALQDGAKAYQRGKYRHARDVLLPLAEQGVVEAQVLVGNMYAGGRALPMDGTQAAKWLRKAAQQGNSEGEYKLGLLYASGWGVPKDLDQAEQWMAKAAAQGHPKARKRLPEIKAEAKKARLAPTAIAGPEPAPPVAAPAKQAPTAEEVVVAEDTLDADNLDTDTLDDGEGIDAGMLEGDEILVAEADEDGEGVLVAAQEEDVAAAPGASLAAPAPAPVAKAKPAPPRTKPAAVQPKPKPKAARPVTKSKPAPKPAPAPAQPAAAKPAPSARGLHGAAWIRQRDPLHYTIQLMASWKLADVKAFVGRHKLGGDDLAYVRSLRRGKPWYSLIKGDYASKQEATEARRGLKPALIKGSPWIRRYRDIQKSLVQG